MVGSSVLARVIDTFGILEALLSVAPDLGETLLEFPDNRRLVDLCGAHDRNLGEIERILDIQIIRRGNVLVLIGSEEHRRAGDRALRMLYDRHANGIASSDLALAVRFSNGESSPEETLGSGDRDVRDRQIVTRRRKVKPRTASQRAYVDALHQSEITFGIGPAGTGKTYIAVAAAVASYLRQEVERIVLSRPAVEAGERLGFLPGDMKEKVDPYMLPLYDSLHAFLPAKLVARLIEQRRIEIAPLAFMRGRTLSSAYAVLDEAQNTTPIQMRMFLTRLGNGSRLAVNGDITQIDLPPGKASGLVHARQTLGGIPGISFVEFSSRDVMRSTMVARIIDAYANREPVGKS